MDDSKILDKGLFLIITANKYPEGDAGAVRQHSFAKILSTLGYEPVVIGIGNTTHFKKSTYDNISYYSVRYPGNDIFHRAIGRLLFCDNVCRLLKKIPLKKVRGILMISDGDRIYRKIAQIAMKNHIQLYHDSVEWYSPCEFKEGTHNRQYQINNNLNTKLIDKRYKVFAISQYLQNHFLFKGINTIRIPVIMDIEKISSTKSLSHSEQIKIVYAGSPWAKDHLKEFIQAVVSLRDEQRKLIRFEVIGINQQQYEKMNGKVEGENIQQSIAFYGRISREDVIAHLHEADFTVLLRPADERYAKAGFPTKVVESMATGTPVICNLTSDLNLYLEDKKNAIIAKDCTVSSCLEALEKVLSLSLEQRQDMQKQARQTAEQYFDWKNYVDSVDRFIGGVEE